MKRITHKNKYVGYFCYYDDISNGNSEFFEENDFPNFSSENSSAIAKLGALEDFEEELGVDLVKLLNIKSVIYTKNALGDIKEIDTKDYGLNINLLNKAIILDRNYYFKDYGKTWAFTGKELEEKLYGENKMTSERIEELTVSLREKGELN